MGVREPRGGSVPSSLFPVRAWLVSSWSDTSLVAWATGLLAGGSIETPLSFLSPWKRKLRGQPASCQRL